TDRAGRVGDASLHGLANPPGGVRRELEALAPVELLDGVDQAEVALLDEIQQRQARRLILLGDRDDQSQVGVDEGLGRLFARVGRAQQLRTLSPGELLTLGQLGARLSPGLDGLGQADLVILCEQLVAPDLVQIQANEILLPLAVGSPRGLLPHYSSVGTLPSRVWRPGQPGQKPRAALLLYRVPGAVQLPPSWKSMAIAP